ncbi:MAG TPA: hypothetical protein VGN94_05735, partial [Methylobacterium sp.]|nr:hypothetical protein [Methylobacterium sp.]
MSARDGILRAIRQNRPAGTYALPPLPDFAPLVGADLIAAFGERLERMGGRLAEASPDGDPLGAVRERLAGAQVIASAVPEVEGNRDLAQVAHPADLADVDVAVVRAVFGVAETGSVLFTQDELRVNAV